LAVESEEEARTVVEAVEAAAVRTAVAVAEAHTARDQARVMRA